jgi:hypothetical protein
MTARTMALVGTLLLTGVATAAFAAPVVIADTDLDLAEYDVLEIETGDVTPLPEPDGIGTITVTRETGGSSGAPGDAYVRVRMEGYDTTGSTGYGQLTSLLLRKTPVDPAAAGGFASLTYRETSILFTPGGQGHATGLAIKQGDNVYIRTAAYTPETIWTPKLASPLTPADFSLLVGPGPSLPDLGASGAPFQIGVFRATSGPAPSAGGVRTGGIDDWVVVLSPPCAVEQDCAVDAATCTDESCDGQLCVTTALACGDEDPCTIDVCDLHAGGCPAPAVPDGTGCADDSACNGDETCQSGACVAGTPLVCDDGDLCTTDVCDAAGGCLIERAATFELAFAKIEEFLDRLKGPACDGSPLVKKVRKKLQKKIAKVRQRVRKADRTEDAERRQDLVYGTGTLFLAARELVAAAVERQQLSPACAAIVNGFVGEVQVCVYSLVPVN